MAAVVAMPAFLTSCDEDEVETIETPNPEPEKPEEEKPEKDQFENLYGYWINSDYSGAMEISKDCSDYCKIIYFVYTSKELENFESCYEGGYASTFTAKTPDGKHIVEVEIVTSTLNKLVLEKAYIYDDDDLSSYVFTRVNETEFYEYLEGKYSGNSGDNDDQDDDAKKLIGTWVGYNGTPGLDYTIKYTLTFYSSGKATEEYSSVSYGSGSMSGTYKYSDGKITEWDMKEGSVLANEWREPSDDYPWTVTFISSKEMKIGYKSYSIKFTKQ